MRLDRATRSDLGQLEALKVAAPSGQLVALGELVRIEKALEDKSIYHKNLMPVTYVTGDVAGKMESPVYAILALGPEMEKIRRAATSLNIYYFLLFEGCRQNLIAVPLAHPARSHSLDPS